MVDKISSEYHSKLTFAKIILGLAWKFIFLSSAMLTYVALALVAFLASLLTFFSGFGLGTLLTPVFILFFPVEVSIALTGVVHFINNLFKLFLVGRHADRQVLWRFGLPAILAAFLGAWCLLRLTGLSPLFTYTLGDRLIEVSPLKFVISALLIIFALMDVMPALKNLQFDQDKLPIGGILSGFFGGLSGHQGALRTAFLVKAGLTKEAFIGTGVVVAILVDLTRLSVYTARFTTAGLGDQWPLVISTSCFAILGAYLGNRLLTKMTYALIQRLVAILLILVALALGAGLI